MEGLTAPCRTERAAWQIALPLVVWAVVAAPAGGAEPFRPARVSAPPVIDGNLGDPAWQKAPAITGFKTWEPDYGIEMPDQTVVSAVYDAENMYFAFRVLDREPSRIKATVTSRDNIFADDWVCINLDSFGNQQALVAFYINPLGIQGDSSFAAGREDRGFDLVWYSAGRIDAEGYTVEVRIPFKSLRYGRADPVRMGVIFERRVSRRSEGGTYPPLNPAMAGNFLIQTMPIEFAGIRHYRLLEVLPDVTYAHQASLTAGRLMRVAGGGDLGVSVKYGLTPQLVADGAVNPDFSQIEADAGQVDVNLRYALFYPEKRPFFQEGSDTFAFGGPSSYHPLRAIVHTRTIVNPRAGIKLTGKLGPSDSIASLYAADELAAADRAADQPRSAHFAVLRYKHALRSDSFVGGFYTGREHGDGFNRVAGADGRLRVSSSSALGFHGFASVTRRSGAETAAGHAVGADYTFNTRNWTAYLAGVDISPRFETDTGYLTRPGVLVGTAYVSPKLYPRRGPLKRLEPAVVLERVRDAESGLWEGTVEAGAQLVLTRSTSIEAQYDWASEVFRRVEFDTSGLTVTGRGQPARWLRMQGSMSRRRGIYYSADPFPGVSRTSSLTIELNPSEKWAGSLAVTYADFRPRSAARRLYEYTIFRGRLTYQPNRYLLFRAVGEYNAYRKRLLTDFLASFTYIPGTVVHGGYGSIYERVSGAEDPCGPSRNLRETRRGFFFKASYLWRL